MNIPNFHNGGNSQSGFTLIELIIVIIITGIIAAVISPIMGSQFQAYTDSSRRATLVQEAQSVMQQLESDLYYALPNSTRPDGQSVELLLLSRSNDSDAMPSARYHEDEFGDGDFTTEIATDNYGAFDVFGCLTTNNSQSRIVVASRVPGQTVTQYDNESNRGPVLVDFELTAAPDCTAADPVRRITVPTAHDFGDTSTFHRLYMIDGKVTYTCDENGLTRTQDFGVTTGKVATSPLNETNACEFEQILGGTFSPPSLLVRITLTNAGESITLARMFQLVNAP